MRTLPAAAIALAEEQFGVVGRDQLLRIGMTRGEVDGLVQRGVLVPVERGAYRVDGGARTPEQAAMAAVIRARPGARVTGPFALGLHGIDGFSVRDPFEVLTQPGRRLRGVSFRHRLDPTPARRRSPTRGLAVVSVTDALVDSGRFVDQLGLRRLRIGLDAARWARRTTTARVRQRAELLGHHDPGAAFFLQLVQEGGFVPESEPERAAGGLLSRFDPPPEPQVWVTPRRRVDWFFRLLRLAFEYLGAVDHATAAARRRDADRDAELDRARVRAVPIVAADLRDERGFLAWVGHVLAARAHELGVPAPTLR